MNDLTVSPAKVAPLHVKKGKIYFQFVYDVGSEINLDEVLEQNEFEGATPEEILPRHVESDLFKFTTGLPISWRSNVRSLYSFSNLQIESKARFMLWPNGYVGVEFSVDLAAQNKKITLTNISHFLFEMRYDSTLREESKIFVDSILSRVDSSIIDMHKPTYCEDYVSVEISSFSKNISEETLLRKYRSQIAHIVRQERFCKGLMSLSESQIEEVWKQKLSYNRRELIIVTYDVAFLYGKNNDDEKRLVELINLHMIELKTLLKILRGKRAEFAERHTEILKEDTIPRFLKVIRFVFGFMNVRRFFRRLLRRIPRVLPIENMMCSIIELKERADAVLSASQRSLEITQDPFLSSVYRTAGEAFDLKAMRSQVKTQLASLTETYDSLIEIKRHKWGFILEIVVILLISVEVAIPVSIWTFNLIKELGWGGILNNPYIEILQRIFTH